jgi:hypothetical protein
MRNMISGSSNTAFGYFSLRNNTSGLTNSAFGFNSLGSNFSDYNSAFGGSSLSNEISGSRNTAFGFYAGYQTQTSIVLTAATNSIFIGYDSRASGNNQTNQIVIGYEAIGLGSNTTVIGNSSTTLFRPYGNVLIDGTLTATTVSATTLSATTSVSNTQIIDNPYVPTGSTDPSGVTGTISWSGNTIYLRNSTGWVRFTGETSW